MAGAKVAEGGGQDFGGRREQLFKICAVKCKKGKCTFKYFQPFAKYKANVFHVSANHQRRHNYVPYSFTCAKN